MLHLFVVVVVLSALSIEAKCPGGWVHNGKNCYKKFPAAKWRTAFFACDNIDARLVDVVDAKVNTFLTEFGGGIWLGLTRCHANSTCLSDYSPAKYENWATGQPDNKPQIRLGLGNNQFAVLMSKDGKWTDEPKIVKHSYVCTKPDDPCKDNYCNPVGSTCKDGKCVCKIGYSGEYCYEEPCHSDPCMNGGKCETSKATYKCTCIDHYSGKNCQKPPPCKINNPCINGVCKDVSPTELKCICKLGWVGRLCNERPCDRNPCPKTKKCIDKGNSYQCVCLPGWSGANCMKEGYAGGDPHYKTFDNRYYDFMGKCEYVFAKDCSVKPAFEVFQQNEPCGWPRGRVSCTLSLRVLFESVEVRLERRGVVLVNGRRVTLPVKKLGSKATINKYGSAGALLDVPNLMFSVLWNGHTYAVVRINQHYQGKTCGLLGTADSKSNNEFQLPDKTITTDITRFANSWKTNPACVNGIVPPDPCQKLSTKEYDSIRAECRKMKQPPFQSCNAKVPPDASRIPNCEYDMCSMRGNPDAGLCLALDNYAKACETAGVKVIWEGKTGFKKCGNPCAKLPCFNGAKCENIDKTRYKCICQTGFSGTRCENVDCRPGYITRGKYCYRRMGRRPWKIARCPSGNEFVTIADEDENKFIYDKFVKGSKRHIWLNARGCVGNKLCRANFSPVYYHNFPGATPTSACAEMRDGGNGKWQAKTCRAALFYICKYENIRRNTII